LPGGKATSSTGPMIWAIRPKLFFFTPLTELVAFTFLIEFFGEKITISMTSFLPAEFWERKKRKNGNNFTLQTELVWEKITLRMTFILPAEWGKKKKEKNKNSL